MTLFLAAFLLLASLPAAAATPEPAPIVVGQSWRLSALGAERAINVWMPPSYAQHPDRRYPVVYVIDGGMDQDFPHIMGLAQLGALSWSTQELILVGIETKDRRRELAFRPTRDAALQKEYPTAGETAAFRAFIRDEVKPLIEARYRTSGEDAVLGESLAGLFIIETLLREPALFDTYVAIDPSLWWDGGRLTEEAAGLLAGHDPDKRRLWLSIGKESAGQPGPADRLLDALRTRPALELRYEPRPQLTHATIYHLTAYEALQAFYARPE